MAGLPKTSIGTLPETGQAPGTLTAELEGDPNQGFQVFSLKLPHRWMLSSVGAWAYHQEEGRSYRSHQWLRKGVVGRSAASHSISEYDVLFHRLIRFHCSKLDGSGGTGSGVVPGLRRSLIPSSPIRARRRALRVKSHEEVLSVEFGYSTLAGTPLGKRDTLNGSTATPCRKASQLPGEHLHSLIRL